MGDERHTVRRKLIQRINRWLKELDNTNLLEEFASMLHVRALLQKD